MEEAADLASAKEMARRCARRVEDVSRRDERTRVLVNPQGTLTAEVHQEPVRFRRGGRWESIDLALERKPDGSFGPRTDNKGLRLSGRRAGGAGDLVTMTVGSDEVGLGWDGALPEPVVAGMTATWPEVKPGVDLVVELTATGFEQFLVVKDRAAVAQVAQVRLPLRTGKRTVVTRDDGHLVMTDPATNSTVEIPAPQMWDAAVGPYSGEHLHQRAVSTRVVAGAAGGSTLVLTPDPAFLHDAARQFPITIDPAVYVTYGNGCCFDTYVQNNISSDQSGSTQMKLGFADDPKDSGVAGWPFTARSYLRWPTAAIKGANVISARLWLWEFHSWSCTTYDWWAEVVGWVDSNTRWGAQPGWSWPASRGVSNQTRGWGSSGSCGDGWVYIDVPNVFGTAAGAGWDEVSVGLRSASESNHLGWKKFNSGNAGSNRPYVEITYNHKPSVPVDMTADTQVGCGTGELRQYLAVTNPLITARLGDDDAQNLTGEMQLTQGSTVVYPGKAAEQPVAPGQVAQWRGFTLTPGLVYTYRLRTHDTHEYGDYTAPCEVVALTQPPGTPGVTIASGNFTVHKITSVTFRPAPGDTWVTGYEYGWSPDRFSMFVNARNDGTATVPITLQNEDGGTLYVRAKNRAGMVSTGWAELDASFPVPGPPPTPVRDDFNGDGRSDIIVTQDLGNGRTGVYLLASLSWEMHDPTVLADTTAYPLSSTKSLRGDFTGDGLVDVLMMRADTATSATVSVLSSDGNGVADVQWWNSSTYGPWSVAATKLLAGRVDGDPIDDIIALSRVSGCSWRVRVFLSSGLTFADPVDVGGVTGCFDLDKAKPVAVDTDADGDTDIAFFSDLGGCQTKLYLLRNGAGSFGAEVPQWDSGAGAMCWAQLQATSADYTVDGRDDIFIGYDEGACKLHEYEWRAAADGSGYPIRKDDGWWGPNAWCGGQLELQSGEYDGDGYPDYAFVYRCCGPFQVRIIPSHGWGGGFDAYDEWQGALGPPGVGWVTAGFDDRHYQLVNVNSGKCLSIPGAAPGLGVQLVQEPCSATALHQRFDPQMWRVPSGRVRPLHPTPGIFACIDVNSSSLADGAKIQQWNCNGTAAQDFWLEYRFGLSEAAVRIVNLNSGKCLDVPGSSTEDGALIQQWTCNGTNAQNFYLRPVT